MNKKENILKYYEGFIYKAALSFEIFILKHIILRCFFIFVLR